MPAILGTAVYLHADRIEKQIRDVNPGSCCQHSGHSLGAQALTSIVKGGFEHSAMHAPRTQAVRGAAGRWASPEALHRVIHDVQ